MESGIEAIPKEDAVRMHAAVVVHAPSAVVKELIENALDAHATIVEVRITEDLKQIVVEDNGVGAPVQGRIGKPGWTSKARGDIHSHGADHPLYGFRGQALSSIAAQAESVTLRTKERTAPAAAGRLYNLTTAACSETLVKTPGSRVNVTRPFAAMPVREKYWADAGRRRRQWLVIGHLCRAFNLIHPQLRLSLWRAGREVARCTEKPVATLAEAVRAVLGRKVYAAMDRVHHVDADGREVTLWLPRVGERGVPAARASDDRVFMYVNGRCVRWRGGLAAVRAAWGMRSPPQQAGGHREPAVCLLLRAPPAEVDDNVAPDKSEVFLLNEARCLEALAAALKKQPGLPSDGGWEAMPPPAVASQHPHDLLLVRPGGMSAVGTGGEANGGDAVDDGSDGDDASDADADVDEDTAASALRGVRLANPGAVGLLGNVPQEAPAGDGVGESGASAIPTSDNVYTYAAPRTPPRRHREQQRTAVDDVTPAAQSRAPSREDAAMAESNVSAAAAPALGSQPPPPPPPPPPQQQQQASPADAATAADPKVQIPVVKAEAPQWQVKVEVKAEPVEGGRSVKLEPCSHVTRLAEAAATVTNASDLEQQPLVGSQELMAGVKRRRSNEDDASIAAPRKTRRRAEGAEGATGVVSERRSGHGPATNRIDQTPPGESSAIIRRKPQVGRGTRGGMPSSTLERGRGDGVEALQTDTARSGSQRATDENVFDDSIEESSDDKSDEDEEHIFASATPDARVASVQAVPLPMQADSGRRPSAGKDTPNSRCGDITTPDYRRAPPPAPPGDAHPFAGFHRANVKSDIEAFRARSAAAAAVRNAASVPSSSAPSPARSDGTDTTDARVSPVVFGGRRAPVAAQETAAPPPRPPTLQECLKTFVGGPRDVEIAAADIAGACAAAITADARRRPPARSTAEPEGEQVTLTQSGLSQRALNATTHGGGTQRSQRVEGWTLMESEVAVVGLVDGQVALASAVHRQTDTTVCFAFDPLQVHAATHMSILRGSFPICAAPLPAAIALSTWRGDAGETFTPRLIAAVARAHRDHPLLLENNGVRVSVASIEAQVAVHVTHLHQGPMMPGYDMHDVHQVVTAIARVFDGGRGGEAAPTLSACRSDRAFAYFHELAEAEAAEMYAEGKRLALAVVEATLLRAVESGVYVQDEGGGAPLLRLCTF